MERDAKYHARNERGTFLVELNEYQRLALRTARTDHAGPPTSLNWIMGLVGEALELAQLTGDISPALASGRVMEHVKKVFYHGHEPDIGIIKKELGDILWYLAVMANNVGLKLDDIATSNIDKLRERYPEGFSAEKSINRKENQE